MDKIAIIGSSGAGKTTLAKKLDSRLGLKAYHLDRFFWQPDWRRKPNDNRIDVLQDLVRQRCWIIEGSYLNSSDLHLKAADIIIFLDISLFVCFWRRIKRHRTYQGHPGRDLPMGSTDKLTLSVLLHILFFPFRTRKKLEDKLSKFPSEKVIRFHSTEDVERFSEDPETYINELRISSSSFVHEGYLIPSGR
jgi:GTPase SAR1 family protein